MNITHFCRLRLDDIRVKTAVKAMACALVIGALMSMTRFDAQSQAVADSVVRLHILANSDSEYDQQLKLKVRDEVLRVCGDIYPNGCTKEQAEEILSKNMPRIIDAAQKCVNAAGVQQRVEGGLVNTYFSNREYDDFTLPAGNYDAVRLTIGSGEGHNWWCVMFPPVCIAASECDISDVLTEGQSEMVKSDDICCKFKIYEWYEKLTERQQVSR